MTYHKRVNVRNHLESDLVDLQVELDEVLDRQYQWTNNNEETAEVVCDIMNDIRKIRLELSRLEGEE